VIVGREGGQNAADDGRLEVHEMLSMRSKSPLVFLSGCETGLGASANGAFVLESEEGSLAQALLMAGVGSVVATLWQVRDAAAVSLAEGFYRYASNGHPADASLARAQRDQIRRSSGFSWAAYTVSGAGTRKTGATVRATEIGH
jgi:CHAT domain-containing protein